MATRSRTDERASERLTLQLTCVVCGRPITLTTDDIGAEVSDRAAFLAEHRECVERVAGAAAGR